jgi:hypothetical protein
MRRHLTFANITSLLALFIALGGTSYAVATNSIGTRQIKNNSVRSGDVRNGSILSKDVRRGGLGGHAIKESSLATVPRATRVGGKSATDLRVKCPAGTLPQSGACIEPHPRAALAYGNARAACESAGRRLPMYQELIALTEDSPSALPAGGELVGDVLPGTTASEPVRALVIVNQSGGAETVPDTFAGSRAFRCVANPTN